MKKHSYKEIERQRREEEILTIAERLLMERGYENLNMDELAEEVGISKPTLYQYFNSKDELIAQALIHMIGKMEDFFSETTENSPLEQLEQFLRKMLMNRHERQAKMG